MPGGRPLSHTTVPKAVRANTQASRAELRNPIFPGLYVYVGDPYATGNPNNPVWQNSFFYSGTSYVGFRHGIDGDLEFIGVYDLTLGAVTGTVAFTLPVPYRGQTFDLTFPIYNGGTDWMMGVNSVDGTTGDVTVYWPVLADPL